MKTARIHTTRGGKHTVRNIIVIGVAALALAGCSGTNGLITGTITCDAATGICTLNGVQVGVGKSYTAPKEATALPAVQPAIVVAPPIKTVEK